MDKEKVIKDLEECLSASCCGFRPRVSCPYNDEEWDIMRDALALLKEQRDIILCKDCFYWRKLILNQDGHGACALDGRVHAPCWFCPDGTRREDNGNE